MSDLRDQKSAGADLQDISTLLHFYRVKISCPKMGLETPANRGIRTETAPRNEFGAKSAQLSLRASSQIWNRL